MSERRHSGEHLAAAARENSDLSREDLVPRWSVGTWLTVIGAVFAFGSACTAIGITEYQVMQLEIWRKEHSDEVKVRREVIDARFAAVEQAQRSAEHDHDHRLTQLEDHWTEVLKRLERIENKLDEKHGH